MPITKSAKKSLKVSRTKKVQNDRAKIELSKALKKVDAKNISEVVSVIDKSAKIGIIAKNKAAHLKSALSKKFSTPKKAKTVKPVTKAKAEKPKTKEAKVAKKTAAKKPAKK